MNSHVPKISSNRRTSRDRALRGIGNRCMRRPLVLLSLLPLLAWRTAAAEPAQPSPPARANKIAIGTIGPASLPADLRIKLEDAAALGLSASGAAVVSPAELARARETASLGSCSDAVCEARLAQITDTRYWLRGDCDIELSTYRLHLELVDAQSGTVVAGRNDTCDICTEADAAETVKAGAAALKAALAAPSPPPAVPPVGPPTAAGSGGGSEIGAASSRPPLPKWRLALSPIALAGAVAAIAGGVYYASLEGQQTNCAPGHSPPCPRQYDTLWSQGMPLFGLGGALAVTGVLLLVLPVRDTPGPHAQAMHISLSANGVGLTGHF